EPEFPHAAIAARRHRKPHFGCSPRLHRQRAGLQHRTQDISGRRLGIDALPQLQTDGDVHRGGRCDQAADGEVLTARRAQVPRVIADGLVMLSRFRLGGAILGLLLSVVAFAAYALTFPALTGRVVDDAGILDPATKAGLERKLAEFESKTTGQLVVVTLKSPQGTSIEDYGYQLGRHWQIGQKEKNTGALLIVAPNERKVPTAVSASIIRRHERAQDGGQVCRKPEHRTACRPPFRGRRQRKRRRRGLGK